MALIPPPDPDLFPTAAMRAAAWVRALKEPHDHEDQHALYVALADACYPPDERISFVLLRIADLAGRIAGHRCTCCGKPLADDIAVERIPDPFEHAVVTAVLDAAHGIDIDDRIRAMDLDPSGAARASYVVLRLDLQLSAAQPTFPI